MSESMSIPTPPAAAPASGRLTKDDLLAIVREHFTVAPDPADRWDASVLAQADDLRDLLAFLRDDERLRFTSLLDIAGVDYLAYPGHRGPRFAVVYLLHSIPCGHRLRVKVQVDEESPALPSVHDLFKIADWHERETFDQYGIVFRGHPNLKRLLNHHEFKGHPLRKDYPCQKRQKLSVNDPMVDELELRLRQLGYTVVDAGAATGTPPIDMTTPAAPSSHIGARTTGSTTGSSLPGSHP